MGVARLFFRKRAGSSKKRKEKKSAWNLMFKSLKIFFFYCPGVFRRRHFKQ
jgi:hypothetical protein